METANATVVTIENTINAPVEKVWDLYTQPEHIVKWNTPSHDWHTTRAENDLRTGGTFISRMEAKDGSSGFDFGGTYDEVRNYELIRYTLGDGRRASVKFSGTGNETKLVIDFEAETENPVEFQKGGWQSILDNFKKYVENN